MKHLRKDAYLATTKESWKNQLSIKSYLTIEHAQRQLKLQKEHRVKTLTKLQHAFLSVAITSDLLTIKLI